MSRISGSGSSINIHEIIHFLISLIGFLVALYYQNNVKVSVSVFFLISGGLVLSSIILRYQKCKTAPTKEDCPLAKRVVLGQGILMLISFKLFIASFYYPVATPYIAIGLQAVWTVILALLFFVL